MEVTRIAIATADGVSVCDHLARAAAFVVVEVSGGQAGGWAQRICVRKPTCRAQSDLCPDRRQSGRNPNYPEPDYSRAAPGTSAYSAFPGHLRQGLVWLLNARRQAGCHT